METTSVYAWTYVSNDPWVVILFLVGGVAFVVAFIVAAVMTMKKGHWGLLLLATVLPPLVFSTAARLAKPWSPWARKHYGEQKMAEARRRYGDEPDAVWKWLERSRERQSKRPRWLRATLVLALFAVIIATSLAGLGPIDLEFKDSPSQAVEGGDSLPLRDDFSRDTGAWTLGRDGESETSLEGGRLVLEVGAEDTSYVAPRRIEPSEAIAIGVRVAAMKLSAGDDVGIVCGSLTETFGAESFVIHLLAAHQDDPPSGVIWFVDLSAALPSGEQLAAAPMRPNDVTAPLTLRATCDVRAGGRATLYANGHRVVSAPIRRESDLLNAIGVYVYSADGGTSAAFDDLTVEEFPDEG